MQFMWVWMEWVRLVTGYTVLWGRFCSRVKHEEKIKKRIDYTTLKDEEASKFIHIGGVGKDLGPHRNLCHSRKKRWIYSKPLITA